MLRERWTFDPEFQLPDEANSNTSGTNIFNVSAWEDFLARLDGRNRKQELFTEVEQLLVDGLVREDHIRAIQTLMRSARYIHRSPVHRTQQEFVLGSDQMNALYGLDPSFNFSGTLLSDDKPTFSNKTRARLIEWLEKHGHRAVAFTNRPCTPPEGHFDTPEAEMGLRAVGLEQLAIVGSGTMGWLSERKGKPLFTYLKPSPIHALTAMLHTAGLSITDAIETANALDQHYETVDEISRLHGARVDVFEDSTNGLESALAAEQQLRSVGIKIDLWLHGISSNPSKIEALAKFGARTYAHLDAALATLPEF
jgi:hypothetical protein